MNGAAPRSSCSNMLRHTGAGFMAASCRSGFPLGLVTSSLVFALVTKLPDADFKSWGWRIPFLVSIVLVALGAFRAGARSGNPGLRDDQGTCRHRQKSVPGNADEEPERILHRTRPEAFGSLVGLHADSIRRRLCDHQAGIAEGAAARCDPLRCADRGRHHSAVRLSLRRDRTAAVLFPGRRLHDPLRLSALLDAGHANTREW